jgi:hypothetical protein
MKSYMNIAAKYSSSTSRHISLLGVILILLFTASSSLAQVTFQNFSSKTSESGTDDVTVPKVSGAQTGDFLLMSFAYEKGSDVSLTEATNGFVAKGWTLIRRADRSNNVGIATFYRFATDSDVGGSAYSFTVTNGPKWSIAIARFTGVNSTTPIQKNNSGLEITNGASGAPPNDPNKYDVTAPSITTADPNTFVAAFFSAALATTPAAISGSAIVFSLNKCAFLLCKEFI